MGVRLKLSILLLMISLPCFPADAAVEDKLRVSPYIVGGSEAVIGDHPYICSLQWRQYFFMPFVHYCAAVIWNRKHLVTTGHCLRKSVSWYTGSDHRVICGLNSLSHNDVGQQVVSVAGCVQHPDYEGVEGYPNDIGVLTLSRPLIYSSTVGAYPLATTNERFLGQTCTLSGWGHLKGGGGNSDRLQEVDLKVISNKDCEKRWSGHPVNNGHICFYLGTGFTGCSGDSGGPARCGVTISGLTSWGNPSCTGFHPIAYARVSKFYTWLKEVAGEQELHSSLQVSDEEQHIQECKYGQREIEEYSTRVPFTCTPISRFANVEWKVYTPGSPGMGYTYIGNCKTDNTCTTFSHPMTRAGHISNLTLNIPSGILDRKTFSRMSIVCLVNGNEPRCPFNIIYGAKQADTTCTPLTVEKGVLKTSCTMKKVYSSLRYYSCILKDATGNKIDIDVYDGAPVGTELYGSGSCKLQTTEPISPGTHSYQVVISPGNFIVNLNFTVALTK